MNIAAAELKNTLKKLTPVKTETYLIGDHGLSAQDSDVLVVSQSSLSELGGTCSIQGKKFGQVINRMGGNICIEKLDKKLVITSAKAKIELEIQPVKPLNIPKPADKTLTLKAEDFKHAVGVAAASADTKKSTAFGGVIQLQSLPGDLESDTAPGYRVCGTDSIVLTVVNKLSEVGFHFKTLLNLTAASVVQLMDADEFRLGETNDNVQLTGGKTTVYASKPVQKYPDFDRFLALPSRMTFGFDSSQFLDALRTVEPMIDESVDSGGIILTFKDGSVILNTVGLSYAQDESSYEQIDPDPIFDPKEFKVKLNAKYLSGFLNKAKGNVVMGVTENPIKLESGDIQVLVMPMAGKVKEKK